MAKKGYTPEQIINKLCEVEILLNQGAGQQPLKCPIKSTT